MGSPQARPMLERPPAVRHPGNQKELDSTPGCWAPGLGSSPRILTEGNSFGPSPHEGRVGVSEVAPVSCSAPIRRGPAHLCLRGQARGAALRGPPLLPSRPGTALHLLLPAGAGPAHCLLHQRARGERLPPGAQGPPAPLLHRRPRPAAPGCGSPGHLLLRPLGEWEPARCRTCCAEGAAAGARVRMSSKPPTPPDIGRCRRAGPSPTLRPHGGSERPESRPRPRG